jgi:hypothetical protein
MTALSSVQAILSAASGCGLSMTVAGDRLEWKSAKAPPADLLDAIRAHKPEILATLRVQAAASAAPLEPMDWRKAGDACELMERAAWEFGGLFALRDGRPVWRGRQAKPPQELLDAIGAQSAECAKILAAGAIGAPPAGQPALAECLSRLQAMPYPEDIDVDRWSLFLADAVAFMALWGPQAEQTGWRASDLFAVPGGLLWELQGREVVALSVLPSEATIRARDAGTGPGATVAFHHSTKPMSLPWECQP